MIRLSTRVFLQASFPGLFCFTNATKPTPQIGRNNYRKTIFALSSKVPIFHTFDRVLVVKTILFFLKFCKNRITRTFQKCLDDLWRNKTKASYLLKVGTVPAAMLPSFEMARRRRPVGIRYMYIYIRLRQVFGCSKNE